MSQLLLQHESVHQEQLNVWSSNRLNSTLNAETDKVDGQSVLEATSLLSIGISFDGGCSNHRSLPEGRTQTLASLQMARPSLWRIVSTLSSLHQPFAAWTGGRSPASAGLFPATSSANRHHPTEGSSGQNLPTKCRYSRKIALRVDGLRWRRTTRLS